MRRISSKQDQDSDTYEENLQFNRLKRENCCCAIWIFVVYTISFFNLISLNILSMNMYFKMMSNQLQRCLMTHPGTLRLCGPPMSPNTSGNCDAASWKSTSLIFPWTGLFVWHRPLPIWSSWDAATHRIQWIRFGSDAKCY